MKKSLLLLGVSLTALSTPTFAEEGRGDDDDDFMQGVYAGIALIYQNVDLDYTLSPDFPETLSPQFSSSKITFGDGGIGGEAMVGYFARFGDDEAFQIAVEGAINVSDNEMEFVYPIVAEQGNSKTELEYSYGVRVLPGYFLDEDVLLYLDLGATWGKFETQFHQFAVEGVTDAHTVTEDDTVVGFRYGLGLEYFLEEEFSLGLNYAITSYDSYTVESTGFSLEQPTGPVTVQNKYSPTDSTASFELKYYFF